MSSEESSNNTSSMILGRFVKTEQWKSLGRGGYGEVFGIDDWKDPNTGKVRPIALKKSRPTSEAKDILKKEIGLLSKLDHLFVVKYLGMAEMQSSSGGKIRSAIVMELCEGDLKTYVLEGLPNIPKESLKNRVILGQVVLGLTYIHSLEIIHKDIKPQNILLWRSSSGLVLAKLADFGFSKGLRNKETNMEHSDTTHFGSWGYMAPELLNAAAAQQPAKCSYATDAYALGIVISFTVNGGKHPFGQNPIYQNLYMSQGRTPDLEQAGWHLMDLVARLTFKDPSKRPRVDTVIYHPFFVLRNDKTMRSYIEKVYNLIESFASWNYSTGDIDDHNDNNRLKLGWYLDNFHQKFIEMQPGPVFRKRSRGHSLSSASLSSTITSSSDAATGVFPDETMPEVMKAENMLKDMEELTGKMDNLKPLNSTEEAKMKESPYFTRLYIHSLLNSLAPKALNFFVWCMMYNMTPLVSTILASTNDHFKKCFEMTEFEFSTLHYDDEQTVKEVWDLKYEPENRFEGTYNEDPHPLFVYASSSLFPKFMRETLVRRFEKHINSTENGIKGRPLLNWVAFNEPSFDSTDESPEHFIRMILEKGGDANGTDIFGLTSVHMAARNVGRHAYTILKILLEEGRGNPNIPNQRVTDPMQNLLLSFVPLEKLKDSLVEKIKSGLASNQQSDDNRETTSTPTEKPPDPLAGVLDSGGNLLPKFQSMLKTLKIPILLNSKVLETLVSMLMSVLHKDKSGRLIVQPFEGRTAAHCAATNESVNGPKLLELLLDHKADPNHKDRDGWTALHCAASNKGDWGPQIMEILLQRGGDATVANKDGKTPLDLSISNKGVLGTQIVAVLEEHLKIDGPPDEKKIKLDDCGHG